MPNTSMEVQELNLPEGIMQHIQRFLDTEEAARTAVLSKSWYSAWSTRPSLDINYRNLSTARQTVERYLRLNLKLERFKLYLIVDWDDDGSCAPLVSELILGVLKLGVNDLHLCLDFVCPMYVLPVQVFAAAALSLQKLYVSHCKIDCLTQDSVICHRLTSLHLFMVCLDDAIIKIVLSGCPLLQILELFACTGMTKIDLSKMNNLKSVSINQYWAFKKAPFSVQFTDSDAVSEFFQLSSLELIEMYIGDEFFRDYLRKFPSLKCLTLVDCDGYENVQISSSSLQLLRLKNKKLKKAQFDVPNIQKLEYSGSDIPSLSFSTNSEEWESCVTFNAQNYAYGNGASWFMNLRKFLMNLSPSRISLCVEDYHDAIPREYVLDFPIPEVENLAISGSPSEKFLRGLFLSCHPKYVAPKTSYFEDLLHLGPDKNLRLRHYNDLRLLHDVLTTVHVPDDVTVEFKYGTCTEWQPIPWTAVLEAWTSVEKKETIRIRFKLKWQGTF